MASFFYRLNDSILSKKCFQNRKSPIGNLKKSCTFVMVFHRILDFKNGLDFYPGPFFLFMILY